MRETNEHMLVRQISRSGMSVPLQRSPIPERGSGATKAWEGAVKMGGEGSGGDVGADEHTRTSSLLVESAIPTTMGGFMLSAVAYFYFLQELHRFSRRHQDFVRT